MPARGTEAPRRAAAGRSSCPRSGRSFMMTACSRLKRRPAASACPSSPSMLRIGPSRRSTQWFFLYTITITNEGAETVQLLSRHWIITDGGGHIEEVKGPGVIGQQPVLGPGESFTYTSGCSPEDAVRTDGRHVPDDRGGVRALRRQDRPVHAQRKVHDPLIARPSVGARDSRSPDASTRDLPEDAGGLEDPDEHGRAEDGDEVGADRAAGADAEDPGEPEPE